MWKKQFMVDVINLLLGFTFAFVLIKDWRAAKREIKVEAVRQEDWGMSSTNTASGTFGGLTEEL